MNILLTGGTGYIGSHTAVVLAQAGHRVVLFDNLSNSQASTVDRLAQITGQRLPLVVGDVRDEALLANTLRDYAITAVVHFAGLKAVGESVANPLLYFANNLHGTIALLHAMQATGVRQLVFSSSATVYGNPHYLPIDEQHPTGSTNPYGRTKLHVEEMLFDLARSDASWHIACLRYFNPAGAHSSGLIGELPNGIPNNLMPYMAQVATGQRAELTVFGDDYPTSDGTGVRDYIHVMDLAEGHAAALQHLGSQPGWDAINLGTGQGYSVLEMVAAFSRAIGRPLPYRIAERRAGDTAACYADASKALTLLGWQAKRNLDDICSSAWAFQQAHTT